MKYRPYMTRPKLRRGFGMIEVLITLLVLSVGVLGVIGMQVSTKKANYEAIQRSTASSLLSEIMGRMRANPGALSQYITTLSNIIGDGSDTTNQACTSSSGCSENQMADHDLYQWEQLIIGTQETRAGQNVGGLTNARACITGPTTGDAGIYTITIAWRGLTPLTNPTISDCGTGLDLYGAVEVYRRVLNVTVYAG